MLGESQRAVSRLFLDTVPEIAARRPHTTGLIDEVEALAVRRSSASFETNPVDVHRATDAVLAGLDPLRAQGPHLVLVVTTNFLEAVNEAVLSRADLVLATTLPDVETIERIVHELSGQWPALMPFAEDQGHGDGDLAKLLLGLDGRRARKAVLAALAIRTDVALDPTLLASEDMREAARWMAAGGEF
ncbi:AAA family ATPase [Sinomonas soli]